MDNGHFLVALLQHKVGVNGYQISIGDNIHWRELFIGKLDMILRHCLLQRGESCREKSIVMFSIHIDVFLVCFIELSSNHELQKFNRCLFVCLNVCVFHDESPFHMLLL